MIESFLYSVVILPFAQAACIVGIGACIIRFMWQAVPAIVRGL